MNTTHRRRTKKKQKPSERKNTQKRAFDVKENKKEMNTLPNLGHFTMFVLTCLDIFYVYGTDIEMKNNVEYG
jgi:hypothetical protein